MKNMAIAFDDGGMHNAEFQIELLNKGASWNVNFTATAVGARWDENYELTNGYNNVNVSLPGAFWGDYIADYDLINDPIAGENPILALGLYKISAIEGGQVKSYFYMDWRTCGFYGSADVRLKYDYATKHFRNISNTQTIDRTYQTVWDLNIEVELETNELEDYWANCLALIPAVSNQPRLIWGPYPESVDMAGYLVYRKLGGGNFTLLYTTPNENTFSYTDPDYSAVSISTNYKLVNSALSGNWFCRNSYYSF